MIVTSSILLAPIATVIAVAEEESVAEVTVIRSANGIIANYVLPFPVLEFRFHEILTDDSSGSKRQDILRDGSWQMLETDMRLSEGAVRRENGDQFNTFSIEIRSDTTEYGRIYPALTPLGDGVVIGVEYLAAARTLMATRVRFNSSNGEIIVAGEQQPSSMLEIFIDRAESYTDLDTDEYVVFMGPATYFVNDKVRAVIDPLTPDWVVEMLLIEAAESIRFYEQNFAERVPTTPTFLITYIVDGYRPGWRGDVSSAGLIAMRLKGAGWEHQSQQLRRELALFVAHEVNHLWNGGRYPSRPEDTWLYEGGAEYMAVKSLQMRGEISQADVELMLSARANRCLGFRSADASRARAMTAGAVYDCGAFIQWIADRSLVKHGEDIFSLWVKLFEVARENGLFDTDDFLDLVSQTNSGQLAVQAVLLLMEDGSDLEITGLPGMVSALGIPVRGHTTAP